MIICDFGPGDRPVSFQHPRRVIAAQTGADVAPALAQAEAARRQGAWIAGWVGYEAGLALEPRLAQLADGAPGPLLALGVYDGPIPHQPASGGPVRLSPLQPKISQDAYRQAFRQAQAYISAGDCYQINLTFPIQTRLEQGSARDLSVALAQLQPVGFGAYADLGVGPIVVSRSPELFFSLTADGRIEARPMKGTAPRHADPAQDAALAAGLAASIKDRAENLMIVDLLRNDISVLARLGTVKVPELFAVDTFATVHQMSSRITAQLADAPDLAALMRALFPCGSITGAPKIRAMQIIAELEPHPRGVYCGSIGWMAPDGAAAFSVAIRTLAVASDGGIVLNVGGGITADSNVENEWEEALWKARYVTALTCA